MIFTPKLPAAALTQWKLLLTLVTCTLLCSASFVLNRNSLRNFLSHLVLELWATKSQELVETKDRAKREWIFDLMFPLSVTTNTTPDEWELCFVTSQSVNKLLRRMIICCVHNLSAGLSDNSINPKNSSFYKGLDCRILCPFRVAEIAAFRSKCSTVLNYWITSLCPPSGEHQPPLGSDSDTSIITGLEIDMSEVDLSTEPECEVSKSWNSQSKKTWNTKKRRTRAGPRDRGPPESHHVFGPWWMWLLRRWANEQYDIGAQNHPVVSPLHLWTCCLLVF